MRKTEIYDFAPITRGDTFREMTLEFYKNTGTEADPVLEPIEIQDFCMQAKVYNGSKPVVIPGAFEIGGHRVTLTERIEDKLPRIHIYDLSITETDGTKFTWLKGKMPINENISECQ